MKFSVLMSVYTKDNPLYLKKSIESLITQSLLPNQIVIVHDGVLTFDLDEIILDYANRFPELFTYVGYSENRGLGEALRFGINYCTYEYVARMDSDDICQNDRFLIQISYLEKNTDVCVLGSQISEFIGNEDNIIAYRQVPTDDKKIRKYLKRRCPFNHMTVFLKKSEVIRVGNYSHFPWNEDYFLWIKLFENGCKFANLDDVLVNVRVGKEMYARRGGMNYFRSEFKLQKYMLRNKIISRYVFAKNVLYRYIIQVILPNSFRSFLYKKILRMNKQKGL